MAFLAELTAQVEELVKAVALVSPEDDAQALGALRDATLRALRHHNHLRTNQFEVESQLDGLEERFYVAGRDGLADALRERRARLAAHASKWTPDVLHFLLELSDRPTDHASLDALEALCASRYTAEPPPLRWEDVAREDGWDDGSAASPDWDDDDDDDDYDDAYGNGGGGARSNDTTVSSMDGGGLAPATMPAYGGLVADEPTDEDLAALLARVRTSQAWRAAAAAAGCGSGGEPVLLSELQIVRETVFMLQGLETSLFGADGAPSTAFRLPGVSLAVHRSLLEGAAVSGRRLWPLRQQVARGRADTRVPLLQVFGEAIRRRLRAFDDELAGVQARFLADADAADEGMGVGVDGRRPDVLVSLAAVLEELQPSLRCLAALADVVRQLATERNAHAFRYLELLFDATAAAQFAGEAATYAFLGGVFFECFAVYLRPIRTWMEDGTLLAGDRVFFVAGAPARVPRSQIWQSQYRLLRTSSGALHAPRFLQPAASTIFTTGKSIVVLRQLGRQPGRQPARRGDDGDDHDHDDHVVAAAEPPLDFASVCPPGMELAPFAQRFGDAFARWMQSKHHAASATLRATLFGACGLGASLDALHHVYLMRDGAAADAFAARVFHGLDTRSPRWHDRYALTEAARDALAGCLDEPHRLSVGVDGVDGVDDLAPAMARRSVRAGIARIRPVYRLPWPVQIIIPAETLAGYEAVFSLLLQVRRASSLLSRHRLLDDGHDVRAADADADADRDRREPTAASMARPTRRRLPHGDRARYFALRARLLWFCTTLQSYLVTLVVAPRVAALRSGLQRAVDVDAMVAVHAQFVRALVAEACLGARLQPIHDALLDLLDLALRLEDAHHTHATREASELHEAWRLSVLASPYQTPARKLAASEASAASRPSPGAAGSVRRRLFAASRGGDGDGDGDDDDDDDDNDNDDDANEEPHGPDDTDFGHEDDAYNDYDDDRHDVHDIHDAHDAYDAHGKPARRRQLHAAPGTSRRTYGDVLQSIGADFGNLLRFATGGLRAVARASSDATAAAKWDMLAEMLGDGGGQAYTG